MYRGLAVVTSPHSVRLLDGDALEVGALSRQPLAGATIEVCRALLTEHRAVLTEYTVTEYRDVVTGYGVSRMRYRGSALLSHCQMTAIL